MKHIIQQLRATLEKPSPLPLSHKWERGNPSETIQISETTQIHTPSLLYDLLHKDIWETSDISILDHIAKRLDISQKLFTHYDQHWRKASDTSLDEPWKSVTALLLYKAFQSEKTSRISTDKLYKRLNVLHKSLNIAHEPWIKEIAEAIRQERSFEIDHSIPITFQGTGKMKSRVDKGAIAPCPPKQSNGGHATLCPPYESNTYTSKALPFTLLFYEGPIARAYLETLRSMNIKPQNIIHLISSTDIASKKPIGRFLPHTLRKCYADSLQKNKIHYWPKHIAKAHPELRQSILKAVKTQLSFAENTLQEAYTLKPLTHYSDQVTSLLIDNLHDTRLHDFLSTYPKTTLLFTGGGIVPASLLNLSHLRFIHVHPGFLPDIKGADCVLWSSLLTGHSSATSFYMSPGIDTGDIIKSCWLPKIKFNIESQRYHLKTLYRATYSFFDPWVRAYVLQKTMRLPEAILMNFSSAPQDSTKGLTFHFMHDAIQKIAINKLFS